VGDVSQIMKLDEHVADHDGTPVVARDELGQF
jgi:hypothetical protein